MSCHEGIQTESSLMRKSVATSTADAPWGPGTSVPIGSVHLRPSKRPRLDEEDEGEVSILRPEPPESTYDPAQLVSAVAESSQLIDMSSTGYKDSKYIVFEKNLVELFETCPVCSRVSEVKTYRRGTFLSIHQKCHHCSYSKQWKSQPVVGSTPVGNIQLSAAIYFTGSSYFKVQKVFEAMHLQNISYTTFRNHANSYLQPAVIHTWQQYQEEELRILSQKRVKVGGDMRADSPGHSAKFGRYSLMNLENNSVIDIQLVQSSEVGGSPKMEIEGLRRSLRLLWSKGVTVDLIITDRHPQIQKFLQKKKITHYCDVWRLQNSISKRLAKVAKDKDCEVVKKWQRGISNHAFWCATSSSSGPERVAKWTSVVNHMQDIHVHDNPLFPQCQHPVRLSSDRNKWFQPGSKALFKVEKILTNKKVLTDVAQLSSQYQTSFLDAFHNVALRFTPRNVVFPPGERLCRLYLAAMHFNENSSRIQVGTTAGNWRNATHFPKKGGHTLEPVKTPPTQRYVHNLISDVFEEIVPHPQPYLKRIQEIQLSCHRPSTVLH
nr:uncharacterized protein LOC107391876 isoform X2 [Nothobranchius furzeri]